MTQIPLQALWYIPQQLNLDYKFKPFIPEYLPAVGDIDAFLKVVKKIDNIEKNTKTIDKWIKDISDLHKSKSSPIVRYSEPMPDLDDLMQEWPEEMENKLRENGFPKPEENSSLSEYVDEVCNIFQIPVAKNKVQSLHLLFCLYAAIKQTQLYQTSTASNEKQNKGTPKKEPDQLVLD
ncbi:hypothetical protein NQ318_019929 [Aromia moschata]|uniref:Intraflagellar transport protein 46 homolog n=1 Tax=Aromia moschata TaxID=1265417 RepID=A0AAV8Y7X9_9CUCU|nr:hypothetical protein NQ318_019929 [Aromia moschata]